MLGVSRARSLVHLERGAIATAVDHLASGHLGSRVPQTKRVLEEIPSAREVGGRNDGSYLSIRKHSLLLGRWRNTTPGDTIRFSYDDPH
jgi:hypothetical protein